MEEIDKQDVVPEHINIASTPPMEEVVFAPPTKTKINRWFIFVVIFIILDSAIAGGISFYSHLFTTSKMPSPLATPQNLTAISIPDDPIFQAGFRSTGRQWKPKEAAWSKELKQNPLCHVREAYCDRIGYTYADFGCDCFVYQYYDSFNTYRNKEERFTTYYPKLWQQDTKVSNHDFVSNAQASFTRQGASCGLAYGVIDEKSIASIDQASTTRVQIDGEELSEIYIPFGKSLTNEERAGGYTEKKTYHCSALPLCGEQIWLSHRKRRQTAAYGSMRDRIW